MALHGVRQGSLWARPIGGLLGPWALLKAIAGPRGGLLQACWICLGGIGILMPFEMVQIRLVGYFWNGLMGALGRSRGSIGFLLGPSYCTMGRARPVAFLLCLIARSAQSTIGIARMVHDAYVLCCY